MACRAGEQHKCEAARQCGCAIPAVRHPPMASGLLGPNRVGPPMYRTCHSGMGGAIQELHLSNVSDALCYLHIPGPGPGGIGGVQHNHIGMPARVSPWLPARTLTTCPCCTGSLLLLLLLAGWRPKSSSRYDREGLLLERSASWRS